MYRMMRIRSDWIDDRVRGTRRILPCFARLKAAELQKGDKVLLYVSGRRRIVGAVEITGTTQNVGRLTKAQRRRFGHGVPCRTLVLLELTAGIDPKKVGVKAPHPWGAWRRVSEPKFIEILAELARRSRKETWERRKAA